MNECYFYPARNCTWYCIGIWNRGDEICERIGKRIPLDYDQDEYIHDYDPEERQENERI